MHWSKYGWRLPDSWSDFRYLRLQVFLRMPHEDCLRLEEALVGALQQLGRYHSRTLRQSAPKCNWRYVERRNGIELGALRQAMALNRRRGA